MSNHPQNFIEARKLLLRDYPFYGLPALGSAIYYDERIATACTDGVSIRMNPKFIHKMPVPHLAAVLAHECIHILRADPDMMARGTWTDGSKIDNLRKLNRALDYWINQTLIDDEHFQFPTANNFQPLYDKKYKGKTVREIYNLIPDRPEDKGGDGGEGEGDNRGLSTGDDVIVKPMTSEEKAEHRIRVQQAHEAAKGAGKIPGWADQFVQKLKSPKIQFKDLLDAWLHDTLSKEDISYRKLNRHYLPDFFVPTTCGTTYGKLWIFMDTSGSCWDNSHLFLGLVNKALKQLRPVECVLQQFDYGLQGKPHKFSPGETLEGNKVKVLGGGGTSFCHPFEHIRDTQEQVDGVIVLTDLCGDFPTFTPPYPVLWVSIDPGARAPFGKVFYLRHGEKEVED